MTVSREGGLSDTLGAVLLIAIIAMGISIFSIALLSSPVPEHVPALTADIIVSGNTISLRHNGGDSLAKSEMKILVDNQDMTNSFALNSGGTNWSLWSIGDVLTYTGSSTPGSIQILYNHGSASQLLQSWGIAASGYTPAPTTGIIPTTSPTPVPVPVAGFTGTPVSGTAPLTVVFTDTSTNSPTGWSWVFGDGDTTNNTLQNPVHAYASAGTYSVTLTASNAGGSSSPYSRAGYITVYPPAPVAGFTGTPVSGTAPLTVVFTDTSSNSPTSWSWVFGDGDTTNNTAQNPVHTYSSAGLYTVALTASNAGGGTTVSKSGYISANPTITSSAGSGGTISPSGSVVVPYGTSQSFTITNSTGYDISSVTVDGINQGQISSYSFGSVTSNHAINAAFTAWNAPTVTSFSPTSGNRGSSYTITITGTNFRATPSILFTRSSGGNTMSCSSVSYVSSTQATCSLSIGSSQRTGYYYITVTNPDSQSGQSAGTFRVT